MTPGPAPLGSSPTATGIQPAVPSTPALGAGEPTSSPSPSNTLITQEVDEPPQIESDGGTALDALTAMGTLAAVAVALGFGVWEVIRARWAAQVDDDTKLLEQVTSVVAMGDEEPQGTWDITVFNGADRPIFDVVVITPGGAKPADIGLVMPHQRVEGPAHERITKRKITHLEVQFTDAAGRRWRRLGVRDVTKVAPDAPAAELLFTPVRITPRRELRIRRLRYWLGYERPIWRSVDRG